MLTALLPLVLLPQGEEPAGPEAEDVYESAAEVADAAAAAALPLAGRSKKCDRFVNQAMEEMGGINICEHLLHAMQCSFCASRRTERSARCMQLCAGRWAAPA